MRARSALIASSCPSSFPFISWSFRITGWSSAAWWSGRVRDTKMLVITPVYDRIQREAPEHQNGGDHLPGRLVRNDVAVPHRRHRLNRPPHPEPDGVEGLGVDEALEHPEDHHTGPPGGNDQIGGEAWAQAPSLYALLKPSVEPTRTHRVSHQMVFRHPPGHSCGA